MDDLISRQAAIDALCKVGCGGKHCGISCEDVMAIETLPSAQPEIIHCRECKHMVEHKHYGNLGESAYTCEGNMDGWILPDSFCSHAERRTE